MPRFSRPLFLNVERDLGVDPKLDNSVVLNLGFKFLHVDRPNIAQRLLGLLKCIFGRIFPARFRLSQDFNNANQFRHSLGFSANRDAERPDLIISAAANVKRVDRSGLDQWLIR